MIQFRFKLTQFTLLTSLIALTCGHGDELEPPDITWDTKRKSGGLMPLATLPDWLLQGKHRPSSGLRAFSTWNHIQPKQKLPPSDLLEPVTVNRISNS